MFPARPLGGWKTRARRTQKLSPKWTRRYRRPRPPRSLALPLGRAVHAERQLLAGEVLILGHHVLEAKPRNQGAHRLGRFGQGAPRGRDLPGISGQDRLGGRARFSSDREAKAAGRPIGARAVSHRRSDRVLGFIARPPPCAGHPCSGEHGRCREPRPRAHHGAALRRKPIREVSCMGCQYAPERWNSKLVHRLCLTQRVN
jgi:hypothetical protein